jgi:predicted RNA-binding protein YlqC (UPF0109 family)
MLHRREDLKHHTDDLSHEHSQMKGWMTMSAVNMKEFIEYIVRSLVDDPSQVRVTEIEGSNTVIFELRVAPEDMGRVIGKGGRVANAMRTLLRVVAARQGRRATLEIVS